MGCRRILRQRQKTPNPRDKFADIRIGKARRLLGYEPTHGIERGLDESLAWYEHNLA